MPLLLLTPGADPLLGQWRAKHDWAARHGIPAHVTVRMPFLEPQEWGDLCPPALTQMLPIELTLARLEDRPGALVVVVEPDDALRDLTATVGALWPSLPPHKGDRADFAYHLTVVRTEDPLIRSHAWKAIAPHLPMKVTGVELWAAHGSPDDGVEHTVLASDPN
jgi:2'-5' RNA ligase